MRRLVIVLAFVMMSCRTTTSVMHAPPNFGKVSEGVYRGGQPSRAELAYLQSIGVKSILKLNGSSEPEAERMGFRVAAFAFNAHTIGSAGTCTDVSRAIAFLENRDNWPVYVHCAAGKDRTGYIVGMYERSLGRPIADVMDELHRYGHRGARSMAFPRIDAELQRPDPRCDLHSESHP